MTTPELTIGDAIARLAANPGDLSDWAACRPGSECRCRSRELRRNLIRAGWPHRRVRLTHRRAPGHKPVEQDAVVVPTAMVRRLCDLLGWDADDQVGDVME